MSNNLVGCDNQKFHTFENSWHIYNLGVSIFNLCQLDLFFGVYTTVALDLKFWCRDQSDRNTKVRWILDVSSFVVTGEKH